MSERGGGRGGGRGRGGGGRGRGRGGGGGGGRGGQGQGGGGQQQEGGSGGGGGRGGRNEFEDEFDVAPETRLIKGDEEDDYGVAAGAGADDDFEEEEDEAGGREGRRMTKQFAWEEERMEEEFNEAGDRMEPFNLKTERTEGYFDETGNFVWKKEEGGDDPWLASLENEEDMEARIGEAALAQRKREEAEAEVEEPPEEVDTEGIMARVLRILKPGESVLKALKRLGPQKKGAGEQAAASKKATVLKTVDERTPEEKRAFDDLTELADQLLRAGDVDIYQQTHESLKALLADAAAKEMASLQPGAGARKRPASAVAGAGGGGGGGGVKWEYRGPDGQVHGPYSTAEILAWRAQGFFTGPTAVEMRRVGVGEAGEGEAGRVAKRGRAAGQQGGGGDDGTGVKKVTFNAEALAADFDDDEEEEEEESGGGGEGNGGGGGGVGAGEWVNSDAVDWQAAMQG